MKGPLFFAKILLFGEYGIIEDSKGLSIPYNFYRGALKIPKNKSYQVIEFNRILIDFAKYLKDIPLKIVVFDWKKFNKDLSLNMYFDSSIPKGYGVGSSGALVAAIYDKYALNKITVLENLTKEKLIKLKFTFSKMESFFHGKSSGLDPLNSYLSLPILINSADNIETIGIPSQNSNGKGAVFLLDSGFESETGPMVTLFIKNMRNENFNLMMRDEFIKYSDLCIENFLKGDIKSLFNNLKMLSGIVLNNFTPMIPSSFRDLWKQGIDSNLYYLKLCGSGGGGYLLGFTRDYERTKMVLNKYNLELVYNF
jgi:mevalonate kinase